MSFWFDLCLSASAMDVFSAPSSFRPGGLPPFYKSLVLAWRELGGAFSAPRSSLVFGAADPHFCVPVFSMTTKSCYLFYFLKGCLTLTVLRNLPQRLVPFTGQQHGDLCPFLMLIIRSLILIARLPSVSSTLLSVFLLLVCQSPFRVFVVLLLRLCLICFLPALWLKVS